MSPAPGEAAMTWTTNAPRVPGFWWYKNRQGQIKVVHYGEYELADKFRKWQGMWSSTPIALPEGE